MTISSAMTIDRKPNRLISETSPYLADYQPSRMGIAAYVCREGRCEVPLTEFKQLQLVLKDSVAGD